MIVLVCDLLGAEHGVEAGSWPLAQAVRSIVSWARSSPFPHAACGTVVSVQLSARGRCRCQNAACQCAGSAKEQPQAI